MQAGTFILKKTEQNPIRTVQATNTISSINSNPIDRIRNIDANILYGGSRTTAFASSSASFFTGPYVNLAVGDGSGKRV